MSLGTHAAVLIPSEGQCRHAKTPPCSLESLARRESLQESAIVSNKYHSAAVTVDAILEPLDRRNIKVIFRKKLRNEIRFDGLDALKAQIHRDIDEARQYFAGNDAST